MNFSQFETFIFDLDGTIWLYPELIKGVQEKIKILCKFDKKRLYITNFTILSRKNIVKKLQSLGLDVEEKELISSGYVISQFLKNKKIKVMVIGEGLKEDVKKSGVKITDKLPVDYLIVGHDLNFNYEKLSKAIEAVRGGAKFIAASMGRLFPTKDKILAGLGPIVQSIEYGSDKKAEIFGKPSIHMQKIVRKIVKSSPEKTVLFGDELDSDIVLGKKLGYFTVLVKTGVDKTVKGKIKPDVIINSVADIKI